MKYELTEEQVLAINKAFHTAMANRDIYANDEKVKNDQQLWNIVIAFDSEAKALYKVLNMLGVKVEYKRINL